MASIKLTYTEQDEEQVKKAFDVLMVWYAKDYNQVLAAMNNNTIVQQNKDTWSAELDKKVQVTQDWIVGEQLEIGNIRRYNNINYVVIQAHTTQSDWTPDVVPALFLSRPEPGAGNEYPDWVQPTGAHDAYSIGDRVIHNGSNWESTNNANVWEPGVFGWTQL